MERVFRSSPSARAKQDGSYVSAKETSEKEYEKEENVEFDSIHDVSIEEGISWPWTTIYVFISARMTRETS